MDPESPVSRMERTLWTVWYYITGAVNRFIRPQPADTVNNDPNTNQESAAEIKHPPSDSTEGDSSREGVEEEQLVATSSLLSSSRPVVEWELCTTEIDLGVDEENMQYKTQLRKVDESKEDGEGKREEQRDKTGNDHSNDSRAKEDERHTMEIEKMPTCARLAGPGNDEHEHAASGPQNLSEVATCQETTEEETDAENATVRLGLPGDHPTKEEKIKETQVKGEKDQTHNKEKEDLEEEDTLRKEENDDKLHSEDERELKAENTEVKACIAAGISPDDMDHMQKGKGEVKEHDAVLLDDHSGREELVKETRLKEENAKADHEKEEDSEAEATEVREEYNNMHCDDDNLVAEKNAFKVCMTKSPKEEDYVHEGEGEVQKIDTVTPDHHPREDQIIKDTQINEEDDTLHHEEERDLEADPEINVYRSIKDISPEDQAHTYEGEAEIQKNDAVTLDDHPKEDKITEETQLEEEDDKIQHEDEQDLEAEDTEVPEEDEKTDYEDEQQLGAEGTEVQLCITTDISPVLDDHKQETEAELQKTDTATLDEHPREDESKETQLEEEDDKLQHEDEQDLEPETVEAAEDNDKTDTEVKVCIGTDVSPEEEAEVQKNDVMTLEDHPMTDNIKETELKEEDDKMQHEDDQGLESEACDIMLQLDSQNVIKSEEKTSQAENQLSAFGDQPDTSVVMLTVITKSYAMTHSSENDEGEKEKWVETERPAVNETTEVPDLDENIGTEAEDTEGENLLTEYDLSGKEAALKTASQLHTAGFTDEYEEDMRVPGVQTKTRQTGVTVTDISEERLIDQDQEKEESVSSESYTGEFYNEIIDSSTSVTVKPKGETTQETDEEFKNTLPGISEGQCAVLQELNTPTCEEIQEGVSKYNNELRRADENTTQRFLEAGDCEEIPATQLPEEVESGDQESLENSDCRTGADHLPLKESMEDKQESKEETETSFGLFVEEHEGTPDLELEAESKLVEGVIQESGLDKEEGKLLTSSMKTEVTGTHVGVVDETERRSEGLHDGGRGSTGGETREAVAAEVVGFVIQESVAAIKLDQSISRPLSLQEDTSEYGFVRHLAETEPISIDDTSVEMQDKAIEKEGRGCEDEEEEAENGIQTLNEMDLQITKETAGELITERGDKEIPLNAELEISQHSETQEINNQSPHRALEISETQIIVAETADEPRPEDLPVTSSEEKGGSVSGHQDVIDEEILDLWIEAVMSEDTDEIRQEEPKPGQLLDAKTDTLNEGEISTENEKVSLAEAICRESEAVSDTEKSSSTVESGFLNQFLSESCIQSSETQLLKSTSTDSLQGIHELVASVSTDIFGVIAQPQTQDLLTEESAETEKESVADIEAQSHLNQESQEKAEERAETLETESGSQKAYEDVEEADVTTMTTQSSPSHDKKVEAEEEHLEVTASDSSDDLKPAESEESESDSQSEPEKDTLNRPQPAHSSLFPVLNEAQVAEEPTIEYENKVDGPVLDFAVQRSRIAVKNPRVRPPKNPRSLLHMPSEEPTPTPTPSSRLPVKLPGGVPLGGIGIGIKLPGLGAGFPVLKKTQRAVKDENTQETVSQEPETKPEEKNDAPPQEEEEAPKKPKWMPPKHPGGFGNPLMAELKTKLKKTPKE
ncbi:titin homolog isoform X3 [Haplochromis burtoni]|uniref:titin homolog isoform X3 n=1 Tax=Haplochromis burtoni TaxID=8153 RepID=UPI0006C965DB|nr:titin homolog isoform X3 [Haplochromis burtoni]